MTKIDLNNRIFNINIQLNGSSKSIKVISKETTDGIEYFICELNDVQITQIRKEKDGNWEQIWGKLDPESINIIGRAISASID